MKENPYSRLIKTMQEQGNKNKTPGIKIARVTHIEETEDKVTDIKIEVDELIIDKDNIYISDYLLKGHKREIKTDEITDLKGSTDIVNDGGDSINHEHIITGLKINHADVFYKDTLKEGDLVSVFATSDRQTYIIISRVVRVDGE